MHLLFSLIAFKCIESLPPKAKADAAVVSSAALPNFPSADGSRAASPAVIALPSLCLLLNVQLKDETSQGR